ncbi:MAG: SDR family NAD(P)-dependent oxidoreductase [Gemmatimonas sp.]
MPPHNFGGIMTVGSTTQPIVRDGLKPGDLVLITGAGGGFGRAFALRFAGMGARLALWDVNVASGEETLRLVRAAGGEGAFYAVDLADAAAIERTAEATMRDLGTPYALINNASMYPRATVIDMPRAAFEKTIAVNLVAPWHICHLFGPAMMKEGRGVVINISSCRAMDPTPTGANYAASKAALISLTKTLAAEWAKHNIRVNAILPGVSMTAQPLENTTPEELIERGKKLVPLGRIGYPEDMAGLAAFLVSPDAAYMTGQGIAMTGGRTMIP